jgi:hypothetical protein
MRDLKADLEICNTVLPIKPKVPSDFRFMEDALFFVEAREGWPEAIERAIKAEAEVERYKLMVKSITGGLDEAIETVHYLETELALLRKVAIAARAYLKCGYDETLLELDKEGER